MSDTPDLDKPVAFAEHDHASCTSDALAHAEAYCAAERLRLTPVRRRTLEILAESHRALGAYDVLERLAGEGFGSQPPVAYRALEFLVEHGLAHKIRRLNAFTACVHPGRAHTPVFFICQSCDMVAETSVQESHAALGEAASGIGFTLERVTIEGIGLCPACAGS